MYGGYWLSFRFIFSEIWNILILKISRAYKHHKYETYKYIVKLCQMKFVILDIKNINLIVKIKYEFICELINFLTIFYVARNPHIKKLFSIYYHY